MCVGLGEGFARHRVKGIGPYAFFEYELLPRPIPDGFFANTLIGPRLERVDQEVSQELQTTARRRGKALGELVVFFGPRMQWAYAAHSVQSPTRLPVWWHPGVSYDTNDEPAYAQRLSQTEFDAVIFLKKDTTFLTPPLLAAIRKDYSLSEEYSQLSVYRPKELGSSAASNEPPDTRR
jgi:hypothetical protein